MTNPASDAINRSADAAKDMTHRTADAAKDTTLRAGEAGRDTANRTADAARDTTLRAGEAAKDATNRTADAARDIGNRTADATRDATLRTAEAAKDNTLRAADAAKDVTNRAADAAKEIGHRAADTAKEVTNRATREASEQAAVVGHAVEQITLRLAEGLDGILRSSQEQAVRAFDQSVSLWRDQLAKSSELTIQKIDDIGAIGRLQLDAILTANQHAAKGFAAAWRELESFNRMAFDKYVNAGARLLEARSVQDMVAIQTDYVKQSLDDALNEAGKLSDMAVKAADEAAGPLNARVSDVVVQFGQRQAA